MARECYFGVGKSNCLTYIPNDIKLELDEVISDWTQPALTSNGTMDGNAFAVNQSSILNEDSYGFKAFDKQGAGTYWHSAKGFPQSIAWYNPKPLKITNVKITNRSIDGSFPNAYQLQYSDDKNTWTTTNTGNGTSGFSASWNIAVSHTGFHKYWRLVVSSATGANSDYLAIGEIDITAQEKTSTLILKAGSKLYIPNSFESNGKTPKFDELVIAKDYTFSTAWNDKRMLFIRHNSDTDRYIDAYPVGQCHSGSTPPTGSQWMFWYDTSSNILKRTSDSGTTWDNYYSFPICIYNSDKGGITSIDQVFNGFGYIGSHWYALKGVKALLINKLNPNGTYKSVEFEVPRVLINSLSGSFTRTLFINNKNGASLDAGLYYYEETYAPEIRPNDYERWYNPSENKLYYHQSGGTSWLEAEENWVAVGTGVTSDGKITSLTPRAIQTQNTALKVNSIYLGTQNTNCLTYIPQDIKLKLNPLNVSITGSPTVSNGVISGFSSSKYATLSKKFTPGSSNWEMVLKLNLTAWNNPTPVIATTTQYDGLALNINSSGKIVLYISSNGTSWNIANAKAGTAVLAKNTNYWIKLAFNGSNYTASYSTNGSSFTTDITIANTNKLFSAPGYTLGKDYNNKYLSGSIDLTQSYIKVNGSSVWQGGTGQLTLQAGSKVYVPNGFEEDGTTPKFDEVVVESDVNSSSRYSTLSNGKYLVQYYTTTKAVALFSVSETTSGTSIPTSSDTTKTLLFYNTNINKIEGYRNGADVTGLHSFPVGIATINNNLLTSIDQVFNGFGYIGNTQFGLPGVKGLASNGFNDNGTYKSAEFTISNPIVFTDPWKTDGNFYYGYHYDSKTISNYFVAELVYDEKNNLFSYRGSVENICIVAEGVTQNSGKITSLTPRAVQAEKIGRKINFIYKGSTRIFEGTS